MLDYILGTEYAKDVMVAKNDVTRVRVMASRLALHAVGTIFLDEFQNIDVGTSTDRASVENTLQELINFTHTRFVLVGTKSPEAHIKSEALRRRLVGERGQVTWTPLSLGADWTEFLERLWEWQVTSKQTPLSLEIIENLHRLTGGVPSYAKRLFTAVQGSIISNELADEGITVSRLWRSMAELFPEQHQKFERAWRTGVRSPVAIMKDAALIVEGAGI